MRKSIIAVVVVALLIVGFFVMRSNSSKDKVGAPAVSENGALRPDPSNATFMLDDDTVVLVNGKNIMSAAPGSAMTEETTLLDKFAYGDVNADGKEDTVLLLARYGAGSGTFIYLAGYVSGPVSYHGSEAVFIGDRISPQSVSLKSGVVTVNYLDRKADEAFAAEPTVLNSKQFVYRNGGFQEK